MIEQMVGKIFTKADGERFVCAEGEFTFYHDQDCCECVRIYDIVGDIDDLIGSPMLVAEEVSGESPSGWEGSDESYTWTFYKFATIKGYVDIRWLGESNGYYSESVNLKFTPVEKS